MTDKNTSIIRRGIAWLFLLLTQSLSAQYTSPMSLSLPATLEGGQITLPRDEGRHSPLPELEWWYVVYHVKGEITGNSYSILVTHFNNFFRFFTVSNISEKKHYSGTTLGSLKAQKNYLDLEQHTPYGIDVFKNKKDSSGALLPYQYFMETNHNTMHLSASLKALKPPMPAAGLGYIPVGSSGMSWYYSLTRLQVSGSLTIEGLSEPISGIAWMDHQWGPFLVSPVEVGNFFESYEWFCVQLDSGEELMISNIYNRGDKLPHDDKAYGGVSLFDQNAKHHGTVHREFKRLKYWRDPASGHFMSMGWELNVPEWDLHLSMEPDYEEQMVDFPFNGTFWEGSISVTGTIAGRAVTGKSFGELMHRFKEPRIQLANIARNYNFDENTSVSWRVKNPDDGNPLHYHLSLILEDDKSTIPLEAEFFANRYTLSWPRLSLPKARLENGLRLRVEAFSIDHTIRGEVSSKIIYVH